MFTLFSETIHLKNVLSIDERVLKRLKIKALILDLDNTLSKDNAPSPELGIIEWLEKMRLLGIKMLIVSNNTNKRVRPLAKELGLKYISFACKPLPLGMSKAIRRFRFQGIKQSEIAAVGDQIFTDIISGNLCSIKTILVEPFYLETTNLFRLKRFIERVLFGRKFR